jgi:hypothetical protein
MMPGHWADFCRLEIKKKKKTDPDLTKDRQVEKPFQLHVPGLYAEVHRKEKNCIFMTLSG